MSKYHMATLSADCVEQLGLKAMVDEEYNDLMERSVFIGTDLPNRDTHRDGEELYMALQLLKRTAELDDGELLVVCVDRF